MGQHAVTDVLLMTCKYSIQLFIIIIFVFSLARCGSGPLCFGIIHIPTFTLHPILCFHFEGEKSTEPLPQTKGSSLLNAATPKHHVTHDQPTSQTEQVDGKWIMYQLYISMHSIRSFSHGQFANFGQTQFHSRPAFNLLVCPCEKSI